MIIIELDFLIIQSIQRRTCTNRVLVFSFTLFKFAQADQLFQIDILVFNREGNRFGQYHLFEKKTYGLSRRNPQLLKYCKGLLLFLRVQANLINLSFSHNIFKALNYLTFRIYSNQLLLKFNPKATDFRK